MILDAGKGAGTMHRGDLADAGLLAVLEHLAVETATGCLHVVRSDDPTAPEALVHLASGQIYAAVSGAERFLVGTRLVTTYGVSPEAAAAALRTQERELPDWRIGEILVHLHQVDRATVERVTQEQVLDALTDIAGWPAGEWHFVAGEQSRAMLTTPLDHGQLARLVFGRQQAWQSLPAAARNPRAVPAPAPRSTPREGVTVDQDGWVLLAAVDGTRSIAELGRHCGFSLLETARALMTLAEAGLAEIGDDSAAHPDPLVLTAVGALRPDMTVELAGADEPMDGSLARVSAALAALMGTPDAPGELLPPLVAPDVAPPAPLGAEPPALEPLLAANDPQAEIVDLAAARQARTPPPIPALAPHEEPTLALEAASVLADLASDLGADAPAPADLAHLDAEVDAEDEPEDRNEAPARRRPPPEAETDTASLLRELSSLGLDDEPAPRPGVRAPTTPSAAERARRKRGIFGR